MPPSPRPDAPADAPFPEAAYLAANPDVATAIAAGAFESGREHYERYGRDEGRDPAGDAGLPAPAHAARYLATAPSRQNIVDLFQDEWVTDLSAIAGVDARPGTAKELLDDQRLHWAAQELGPFQGRDILELGPLEGAHSYMLEGMGARSVTAVEGNSRAFLKCLCMREILDLKVTKFLLGDFNRYLDSAGHFDVIIACGVLYHMRDPLGLLKRLSDRTDRLFLWTHYYDASLIAGRADRMLFTPVTLDAACGHAGARRRYPRDALSWPAFCGGPDDDALWLTRDTLLDFLDRQGMAVVTAFDEPGHRNGPGLALCARR